MAMNRYPARRSASQPAMFGDWSDFLQGFGFPGFFERTLSTGATAPVDVCERGDEFIICMACAGCRPEDIDVTVEDDVVRIRGQFPQHAHGMMGGQGMEQSQHQGGQPMQQSGQQGRQQGSQQGSQPMSGSQSGGQGRQEVCLIRELPTGRFERDIALPMGVDAQQAHAHFENGLLTLTIPKARAAMGHRIQVSQSAGSHSGSGSTPSGGMPQGGQQGSGSQSGAGSSNR